MPELPEVETTVKGLNRTVKGKKILSVTTDYRSEYHKGKDNIKDPKFFLNFRRRIVGKKILRAERRAKNILIHLSPQPGSGQAGGETIIVHMKMTGHFVYDRPETKFVRLKFALDNSKDLLFSDLRKFAKVTVVRTEALHRSPHLQNLGPEPLDKNFGFPDFRRRLLLRPRGKIKQVLLDQSLISGIGNIYSDEILWRAGIHPLSHPDKIPETNLKLSFRAMKELLRKGLDLGGDSTSDYRNIEGGKGKFQNHHRAYQRTGERCLKPGCRGKMERLVIGSRSTHFCNKHQKLYPPRRRAGK
ncbi:MAG: bifunctional DNA-formamidopyrimidine glycosylase/DNA-(apurinic or apyrimidinic site) lyase [Minisyncoccia bacterium]